MRRDLAKEFPMQVQVQDGDRFGRYHRPYEVRSASTRAERRFAAVAREAASCVSNASNQRNEPVLLKEFGPPSGW